MLWKFLDFFWLLPILLNTQNFKGLFVILHLLNKFFLLLFLFNSFLVKTSSYIVKLGGFYSSFDFCLFILFWLLRVNIGDCNLFLFHLSLEILFVFFPSHLIFLPPNIRLHLFFLTKSFRQGLLLEKAIVNLLARDE